MGGKGSKQGKEDDSDSDDEMLEIGEYGLEESTSPLNYISCKKNPGHNKFIPVKDLTLKDLPEDICSQHVLDYIQAREKLVVHILVKDWSHERPDDDEQVKKIGRGIPHVATGFAWCTEKEEVLCVCSEGYSGLIVYTNHHVVFDEVEAKLSKVKFFYNSRGNSTPGTVAAHGVGLREHNINKDLVGLKVCVHKENFYDQINSFSTAASNTWDAIPRPFKEQLKKHAIIISHPHGAVKQVTFGELVSLEEEDGVNPKKKEPTAADSSPQGVHVKSRTRKLTVYTAATCPGSSGAPVLLGYYPDRPFTHSSGRGNGTNFSASY